MNLYQIIQVDSLKRFDRDTEQDFRISYNESAIPYFRLSLIIITLASLPYSILDTYMLPEHATSAWVIRFGIWIPMFISFFVLSYFSIMRRFYQAIAFSLIFVMSFGVLYMILVSANEEYAFRTYYTGVCVIMMLSVTTWLRFWNTVALMLIVSGSYVAVAIFGQDMLHGSIEGINNSVILSNNLFFLLSFSLIAGISSFIVENFSRKIYVQQRQIIEEQLNTLEKNEELKQQNEEILTQRDEIEAQQKLVIQQKQTLEDVHKNLQSSINYAQRIQSTLLPPVEQLKHKFEDAFVFFKPRDTVSGDFYWFAETEDCTLVVVADCTGHGVPGAFMSVLGMTLLHEIVKDGNCFSPAEILNKLRAGVINILKQNIEGSAQKDGMDMSVICFNHKEHHLSFAGAYNGLYIIRGGELMDIKAQRMPVAIHVRMKDFEERTIPMEKGDFIYLFSDGFVDQFGGSNGRKLMSKPFKKLLLEVAAKAENMEHQKQLLSAFLTKWSASHKQIDDILLVGVQPF